MDTQLCKQDGIHEGGVRILVWFDDMVQHKHRLFDNMKEKEAGIEVSEDNQKPIES